MKLLTIIFLLFSFLRVSAFDEDITIKKDNASLETVLREIEKQSEFRFFFNETLMKQAVPVTIDVRKASLVKALEACFGTQPALTYAIVEKTIIVKRKEVRSIYTESPGREIGILNVKGKVTDEKNQAIPKASVVVKGKTQATTTNTNGEFELSNIDDKSVLIISSVGYVTQEIQVAGRENIFAQMKINAGTLDEAVVVAYNTTTKRANTGAVTVLEGEKIQNLPNRSFDRSLQGLVPGLLVTQGSGLPGGGVSNFVLRGIATAVDPSLGSTVRNPLIVIDGIPVTQDQFQMYIDNVRIPVANPLAQLNPSDFETITVLKDASAIALYGSRASNGVIVITTKKGKAGKTVFGFRHQTDVASKYMGNIELLNQEEYLELVVESYRNLNSTLYPNDAAIYGDLKKRFPVIINGTDSSFYPQPNWYGELFNDRATTIANELSVIGGNEKSNFYLNFEYTKQNGVVKSTGYDRKSMRFNFENRPTDWLKFGLNTTLSYNVQDYGTGNRAYAGSVANNMSPLNPVRYTDGSYVLNYRAGAGPQSASLYANPVAAEEYNINRNIAYRGLANFNGELTFLKYFKFNTITGIDFLLAESKEKADPRLVDPGNFSTAGVGRIEEQDLRRANVISTNMLRYIRTFGFDHAINLLIGQEAQIQTQKSTLIAVQDLGLPYYDQINSPGVNPLRQSSNTYKETLLSYFAQANYGFRNKYFLTGSFRRDGSSRFGEDRRYGNYWSTGVGWVVSSESFMKGFSSWLNYFKLRGSIGAAGNAGAINAMTKFDQLEPYSFLGGTAVMPVSTPGNPDVKWEQTFSWDAGLEARFWNERISITADVYKRITKDLIYQVELPASTGYPSVLRNIGKMNNQGVELSISITPVKSRNFSLTFDANWSMNQNKLVKADVPTASLFFNTVGTKEGENFNSFYMPVWAGVNPANGVAQWYDSSGNIVTVYPSAIKHRKFVGKPQPDGFGAFSTKMTFKAIEISAHFYYQYGYQILIQDDLVNDGRWAYMNQDKRALDRWQKPGDIAANPRRVLNNTNGSAVQRPSTRYLFDGDYIRLQNVTVGWRVPSNITVRLRMSSLRVFIQGNNLAVWTKYPGQDPDLIATTGGTGNTTFPSQRSFSFGLNANF